MRAKKMYQTVFYFQPIDAVETISEKTMPGTVDASELDRIYELLVQLIQKASDLAMDGFNLTEAKFDTKQGDWDLVTYYDKAVEDFLIAGIRNHYPTHK